ncbi:MAG: IPT/TIG domain-containing protein [Deltaproteobacteria bacterium]|nr:IPT/TIG domain-containing protein [Deltaproteobacteria bacterium]
MKVTPFFISFLLASSAFVTNALAQAGGSAICGPNCAAPGRVVLCNDAVTGSGTQMINCGANALPGEATCASFTAPAGSLLRAVYSVLGPLNPGGMQFDLEVYVEAGTAVPGARIAATAANSYGLEGDPGRFQLVDVTALGDIYPLDGRFRVCLRKQFEDGHNVCLDANGEAGDNWVYDVLSRQWFDLSLISSSGDFIIRPEIEVSELAPWLPGGACDAIPTDAGVGDATVSDDASPAGDATSADAGVDRDASSVDATPGLDATSDQDATATDAQPGADAQVAPDASVSVDAGLPLPPPEITAVSPGRGSSVSSTDIIITGRAFVAGLSVRVGQIPAIDVRVLGSTTINAVVPARISAGTFDVVVINPDGQTAIAAAAFEVIGESNEVTPDEGCNCRTGRPAPAVVWLLGVFAALIWRSRRG